MRGKVLLLIIIVFFSITLVVSSYSKVEDLSMEEKLQDFEYIYNVIKEGYPYLDVNKRLNNIDWLSNKENYINRIKSTKNDKEFIKELSEVIDELNNGHTNLIKDKDKYKIFKESYSKQGLYDFFDDEKVKDRYDSLSKIGINLNKETKHFNNNLILKDVVKDKVGYMNLPKMSPKSGSIKKDMKTILDYIKTLDNHKTLIIDIRGNRGGNDVYWKEIVSNISNQDIKTKGFSLFRGKSKVINYYIKAKNIKLTSIDKLPESVIKNAPNEVSEKFSGFLELENTIKTNHSSKFKGNIYLLVDEQVFSSAESFAVFCKDTKFATLVGNTTGGGGGGYGPVLFNLKNSGLIVRINSDMFLTRNGICDEEFKVTPDFLLKNDKRTKEFKDDNCIKKVLEIEGIDLN
ncbi:peptidase S41 [Romboutsia maritimum]|uniref:Peptidase S41 n=1 Tax=Romboutsia maritimum TaxID=2020948 RepID=A0A371IVU7_9FIRM|nr:S41 family peptidase [Romboutsia maritimum]RDY24605.1 peptidase S41 [Romboutsia maritimum]